MNRPLFGLNVSTSAASDPVAEARTAEKLGFDFVSANDHPCGTSPTREVWTMLTWIAAATSRIMVATRVLGVPYRPPAVVAKMSETLARLSGGRLILGLGGGASDEELRAFGLPVPSPRQKIDGLEDAIHILHGLWSEPAFSFDGPRYAVRRATMEPKPPNRIPVWVGTYGPRGLALAGRLADGWIPTLELALPDRARAMRDQIVSAASDAGRDPGEITCCYNLEISLGGKRDPRPQVVSGSPDEVIERLLDFVALGFDAMNFILVGPDHDEQRERLAHEVIPVLRGGGGVVSR